jgi:hypothetical protein
MEVDVSVGGLAAGRRPQAVRNLWDASEPALSSKRRRKSRRENLLISASLTGINAFEKCTELTAEMQL